jgi:hypothetical protein
MAWHCLVGLLVTWLMSNTLTADRCSARLTQHPLHGSSVLTLVRLQQ